MCPMASIGRNTCPMAAFSGFKQSPKPPPSGNTHGMVPGHCHGHQNGQQSWSFFCCPFICCCPGSRWGDMGQVVVQWWRPVASREALDMPHWALPPVLLRHIAMAIEMANNGGAFVCYCQSFDQDYLWLKTMLWSIETNTNLYY